ncbi:hypothetical protein V6N13_105377 [Hibiscus sabdariffa]
MVATKLMALRLTFVFLVLVSLLTFHECSRDIGIDINGNELDQNPTTDKLCWYYINLTSWCCKTLPQQFCWPTQKECLANCPPHSSPPHAVP